jgi:hypothetical protein
MRRFASSLATPLPTIDTVEQPAAFEWPRPPWAHPGTMAPLPAHEHAAAPCCIETFGGASVEGALLNFDSDGGRLLLRIGDAGVPLAVPLSRVRRLTLLTAWPLARRLGGAPAERSVAGIDAEEREYRIDLPSGGGLLVGRTKGTLRHALGLFLFTPLQQGQAMQRVFVPRHACARLALGPTAEEVAAARWIDTPAALLAAIDAQRHAPVRPLGEALIALGLVDRATLEAMLRQQGPQRAAPLGEMLVAAGHIDRADLQTALAHKMGCPVVNLARFPIDVEAAGRLSHASRLEHRALPLMQHGQRLFVAVDELTSMARLKALPALAGLDLAPVLASRGRLTLALAALAQEVASDVWRLNVPLTVPAPL